MAVSAISITELKQATETVKRPTAEGMPWTEANLHKTLETAAYALAQKDDPELDKKVDEMIALIAAAQQPDGFIHAWPINRPNDFKPWSSLFALHDGYVTGHLVEAAIAHTLATGKTNYLDIARKAADQAYTHFITQKNPGFCGHAEFELALVELYRLTGNRNYLDLARDFIERRGQTKQADPQFPYAYFQDDLPVREQQSINGHAVRAVFFLHGRGRRGPGKRRCRLSRCSHTPLAKRHPAQDVSDRRCRIDSPHRRPLAPTMTSRTRAIANRAPIAGW